MNIIQKALLTMGVASLLATGMQAGENLHVPTQPHTTTVEDNYTLRGKVLDKQTKEPLSHAQIMVMGTSLGALSDHDGMFTINGVPRHKHTLRLKYVGYLTKEINVDAAHNNVIEIEMQPAEFNMEEVVVSANRTETRRHLAPVLVNVTDKKLFAATNSVSLDEALKFNPGIRVEDNCQNCGFNQVRINGLDGAYSQVVINSRSIFSALAAVYGLEMLPTSMIDRVEVVRGGGSALYGSSAIGGTINIITKTPTHNTASASYTLEGFKDNYSTPAHNVSLAGSILTDNAKAGISIFGRIKSRAGLDFVRPGSLQPGGKDGYSEMPRLSSSTLGTNLFANLSSLSKVTLDYFYTQEERRGGDALDLPEHEANIAESLRHNMHSGILRFDTYLADGHGYLTAFMAGAHTTRNSYYGGGALRKISPREGGGYEIEGDPKALDSYGITRDLTAQGGVQYVHNFDHLLFMPAELTAGVEYNYNKLNDKSGYRPLALAQTVSTRSAILQQEWKNDRYAFLIGMRYDHLFLNTDEKQQTESLRRLSIVTPRATFRYNPTDKLHFRLSYAHGFRAPQYFDEELHVAFAGGEGVPRVLSKNLKEESSRSITASADYYFDLTPDLQVNLMAEGFYTRLLDKFNAEERILNQKRYLEIVNSGKAAVYGVNLEARIALQKRWNFQGGLTWQRSLFDTETKIGISELTTREFIKTPNLYGYFVLGYNPTSHLALNIFGDYTGKMWIGHEAGEKTDNYITASEATLTQTPSFFTIGTKVAYSLKVSNAEIEINGGVNNIFNAYQRDFDEGPTRASAYIYGPKAPRSIFAGVKVTI